MKIYIMIKYIMTVSFRWYFLICEAQIIQYVLIVD